MSQPPRRVELRLTIPAAPPYHELAGELAGKFAEYAGAGADAAQTLAQAVEASVHPIGEASPLASINVEMTARERELVVTVNSDATKKLTCPLPD